MFNWLAQQGSKFVWRKILTEHPGLLDLLLPGNEAHLATARKAHPKLDEAINKFGLPPQDLVQELLNGPQKPRTHNLRFDPQFALNSDHLSRFFETGYLHMRNAVSPTLIQAALRHVNASIGRGRLDRTLPGLVMVPPTESQAVAITDLFDAEGSALPTITQCLIGKGKVRPIHAGQVALRFPNPLYEPNAEKKKVGGKAWHVDGFGQGQHSPFTLLVGVCLSDVDGCGSGNFAVHPGAHWSLQQAVKDQVTSGSNSFSKFDRDDSKPDLGEPTQLNMKAGDIVVAHQKLPHLGCQNFSANIRYQVYFRVQDRKSVV